MAPFPSGRTDMAQNRTEANTTLGIRYRSIRVWTPVILTLLLSACGETPLSSAIDMVQERWGSKPSTVDHQVVASMPYASMGAKLEGFAQSLVVLSRQDGRRLHWVSPDYRSVVTRDGRLVRTIGLAEDFDTVGYLGADPVVASRTEDGALFTRQLTFPKRRQYAVPVTCTTQVLGEENISVGQTRRRLVHVREHCRVAALDWDYVNDFWKDPETGFIWKSVQHITPDMPVLELEVFKPPAL